jgi:hypothetical protein
VSLNTPVFADLSIMMGEPCLTQSRVHCKLKLVAVPAGFSPSPARSILRALTLSPSLLRGTRRRRMRFAEIGKIWAHQPHVGSDPIAEGRVRD